MKFFSLYSKTRSRFFVPFAAASLDDAVNQIAATIADRSASLLLASAEDYVIYEVAYFDIHSGDFIAPEPLDGIDLVDFEEIISALEYADKLFKDSAEANALARLRFEAEQAKASGRQAMEVDSNG